MDETQIQDPQVAMIQAELAAFLDEHGTHEFENHGDYYTYGEYITLAEMATGDKAGSNCYIASCEVLELVGNEAFGGENMRVVAVANEDTYHAALALAVNENWYVIDFTIRQFDEELPFPYVADQNDWKRTIDWSTDGFTAYCTDASNPATFEEEDYWD